MQPGNEGVGIWLSRLGTGLELEFAKAYFNWGKGKKNICSMP